MHLSRKMSEVVSQKPFESKMSDLSLRMWIYRMGCKAFVGTPMIALFTISPECSRMGPRDIKKRTGSVCWDFTKVCRVYSLEECSIIALDPG